MLPYGLRPRAVFSRPRSQFFTIRTSQPANNIYIQKQLHFLISLEFSLVEKCHACFIKKISQLKSDIPSCRCKNFSLKVVSVRSDGGVRTPRTLPLDPPLCHHRPSLHHDLLRLLRNGTKLPISPEEDHPS